MRTITAPSVATANDERGRVHRVDRVVDEHAERGEREQRGQRHDAKPSIRSGRAAGAVCHAAAPIISADAGHSVATSVLSTLPPVASMYMKKPSTTAAVARPAPSSAQVGARAPAGEGEDRDHAAEQQQVGEQVGEVERDLRAAAGGQRSEHQRGADGGDRQRSDDAVEPEAGAELAHARAHEQHHRHVAAGEEGEPEDVGAVGERRLGESSA